METENKDHIEEILRRFLTKGETMNWDELRTELRKDEYAHVKNMVADGATDFTECGPGAVLQGLIKKIAPEATAHGIA